MMGQPASSRQFRVAPALVARWVWSEILNLAAALPQQHRAASRQATYKRSPARVRKEVFETPDCRGSGPRRDRFSNAQWK
jgi:hypothetical protein